MKENALVFLFQILIVFTVPVHAGNPKEDLKAVAEKFVRVIDQNDADQLGQLLHPEMLQFVKLGDNLMSFKAADFIQMIADKKIGGVPRKVTHQSATIVRGETAQVVLNAVSHEYDFMYQLSMAKDGEKWVIVGILVDIIKLG